jgi:hypothetical protein
MKRTEFVFTIGFQGDAAVVDRRAQKMYGSLSTMQLAEEGLYRAAFSSALYSGNTEEMKQFLDFFSQKTGLEALDEDRVKRLFGIYTVPDQVKRIISV